MKRLFCVVLLVACSGPQGPQEIKSKIKSSERTETSIADFVDVEDVKPSVEVSGPEGEYLAALRKEIPILPGQVKLGVGPHVPSGSSGHMETTVEINAVWWALPNRARQRGSLEFSVDYKRTNAAGVGKAIGELLANRLKDSLPKNAAVPVPARSVTVGTTIACSLHEDKSVHCWGWQVDPLVGPVPSKTPLSDVVEIAAGSRVVCARLASGGIECLGKDRKEESTKPYVVGSVCGIAKASKLAMNSETGCALVEGGKVRCWSVEQRNPQDQPCAYPSSEIGGVHHASALSLGSTALCALVGGKVLCWGTPGHWEKGAKPVKLPAATDLIVGITPCVLGASGQLTCQRMPGGDSDAARKAYEIREAKLPPGSKVSLTAFDGCAITPTAQQVCWGFNERGMLGDWKRTGVPQPVFDDVISVGLSQQVHCSVTKDGSVWCRGTTNNGNPTGLPKSTMTLTKLTIY